MAVLLRSLLCESRFFNLSVSLLLKIRICFVLRMWLPLVSADLIAGVEMLPSSSCRGEDV